MDTVARLAPKDRSEVLDGHPHGHMILLRRNTKGRGELD